MPDSSTLFGEIVMWAHASLSMVAYLLFIIASLMAAFFLYQENRIKKKRLALEQGNVPSLGVLGDINYKVIAIGFVLFTVGLLLGVGLNAAARGEIPRISIRQTLPVITWLIYVIYLIDRSLNGLRGKLTAIWSIIAGAIAVVSFIYEMSFLTSRI